MIKNDTPNPDGQRRALAGDPHRPVYHFLPPANWMNDPNGLVHWQGRYHLFYQYNPHAAYWDAMHWGHAYSDDLVHWQDAPVALAPSPDGPDKDGVWSGCMVDDRGTPTIVYTAVHPETQCIATGDDDLTVWTKHADNPVIPAPPPELDVKGFRDPIVWKDGDFWYMTLGSGIVEDGVTKGAVLLYRGETLYAWEYVGPLFTGDGGESGDVWECPVFFPDNDKHALLVSILGHKDVLYFTGNYADHRFDPVYGGIVDYGREFFAPQVFTDAQDRRLMFGWISEARDEDACNQAGWSGVMSLPRVMTIDDEARLVSIPAPELESLRDMHHHIEQITVEPEKSGYISDISGDALEIAVQFTVGEAAAFGLSLRRSPDGQEETRVFYDTIAQRLVINRRRSSLSTTVRRDTIHAPLPIERGSTLNLRIFVDRSVIEVYADSGRTVMTARIYPTRADSTGIDLFSDGDVTVIDTLDVWTMKAIWPIR